MWVNGEKYVFSEHVTAKGTKLFQLFKRVVAKLPRVQQGSEAEQLKQLLINWDLQWCMYEQAYIGELMVIERDARRFIYDLVDAVSSQAEFIKVVGQINAVANVQGQGRQDFAPELLTIAQTSHCGNLRVADLKRRVTRAFAKLVDFARTVEIFEVDP